MEPRHWEYTFYYHTRNLGDRVRYVKNPFTGEAIEIPVDPGLTEAEWEAIQQVLTVKGFDGPLPEGAGYRLFMPDGESVGIRGGGTGFAVEIVMLELSNTVLNTLIEIAQVGNLAFTSITGDKVRLLDGPIDPKTLARWPDAQVFQSAADFKEWLVKEIGGRKVFQQDEWE